MGKYFAVISNSIKKNLAYRANNFIAMVSILLSFIVLFFFWNSIYMQGNQIGTYSLNEIISYYIFVTAFQLIFTGDNTAWSVSEEIRNGQISNNILKPINYLKYKLSQSFGNLFYKFVVFLPVILIVIFILRSYLTFAQDLEIYIIFPFVVLISYLLYFLIYFSLGITAFWIGESTSLFWASWIIINFMQGTLIPIDLLPEWFLTLSTYLPFKYLFYIPIGLLTGRVEFNFSMVLVSFFWCVVIFIFAEFLYLKGIKKYEGYGI